MLVSAAQWSESAIRIHISSPSWTSLPLSRSSQSIELSSLCYIAASQELSVLHRALYLLYSSSSSHSRLKWFLFTLEMCHRVALFLHVRLCWCVESSKTLFIGLQGIKQGILNRVLMAEGLEWISCLNLRISLSLLTVTSRSLQLCGSVTLESRKSNCLRWC